jgi:hypothetical protein
MAPSRRKRSPAHGRRKPRASRRSNAVAAPRRNSKAAGRPHPEPPAHSSKQETAGDSTKATPPKTYRDARALVNAIFRANDPVKIASELLKGKDGCKVWLQLLEYGYGKPVQEIEATDSEGMKFNFITLAPRPNREIQKDGGHEEET